MGFKTLEGVFNLSYSSGFDRLVLLALAYCASDDGTVGIGPDFIAKYAGGTVEDTIAALDRLAEKKDIIRTGKTELWHEMELPVYYLTAGMLHDDWPPEIWRKYFGKKAIPGRMRKAVFERDAYRCKHCGSWVDLSVDHIFPEILGGLTELDNLQTLCRSCNSRKGAQYPYEPS